MQILHDLDFPACQIGQYIGAGTSIWESVPSCNRTSVVYIEYLRSVHIVSVFSCSFLDVLRTFRGMHCSPGV
jgi:hypothetical protein